MTHKISIQTSLEEQQGENPEVVALSEALDQPRQERLEAVRGHVGAGVDEGGDDAEAHLAEGLLAALGQAHAPHVRDYDVDGLVKYGNWKYSCIRAMSFLEKANLVTSYTDRGDNSNLGLRILPSNFPS